MVPSGNATTVCPARSRAATASTTTGSRRRLVRSIGITFISRASAPSAGQLIISALATNEPGSTAPIAKMSTQDTCPLTTSTPAQVANRAAGHGDPHAQAAQHQPAVAALQM